MTITIPETAAELEELLSDRSKMNEIMKDNQLKDVVDRYAKIRMSKDPSILAQLLEQQQKSMADMLRDNQATKEVLPKAAEAAGYLTNEQRSLARKSFLYNKKAPGVALDNHWTDAAEYFQALWGHNAAVNHLGQKRHAELQAKLLKAGEIQNAFGSTVPADGGFLIPEVLRSDLLMWSLENSVVRQRATVIPMGSLRVPIPLVDSSTNQGSVFGGIQVFWTEEGAQLVDTSASFGQVTLEARKLTAYSTVPNELVADAPAFEGFFGRAFPAAINFAEDRAFLTGSGVGEPAGSIQLATNPAIVQQAAEGSQPATSIVWENIVKMYARMLPTSLNQAVWVCSPNCLPQLLTMALSVGTGGAPVWLASGVGQVPITILGRPLIVSEKVPGLGSAGDINFVDFGYYLIGDRQVMQTAVSEHVAFQNDKTAYRVVERVDGRPWLKSAITPANGATDTLSPFVQLVAR